MLIRGSLTRDSELASHQSKSPSVVPVVDPRSVLSNCQPKALSNDLQARQSTHPAPDSACCWTAYLEQSRGVGSRLEGRERRTELIKEKLSGTFSYQALSASFSSRLHLERFLPSHTQPNTAYIFRIHTTHCAHDTSTGYLRSSTEPAVAIEYRPQTTSDAEHALSSHGIQQPRTREERRRTKAFRDPVRCIHR